MEATLSRFSNIQHLDGAEDFNAKISDFGPARHGPLRRIRPCSNINMKMSICSCENSIDTFKHVFGGNFTILLDDNFRVINLPS